MAIRLNISQPVTVAMGPAWKDAGWGTHQFPMINRLPDGRIVIRYHIVEDSCEDYGKESGWAVSEDEGATWREVTKEELPAVKARFGVRLPSGKYIRGITHRPWPIDEALHQKLQKKADHRWRSLPIEDVPDLFPKTWTYAISGPDTLEETVFDTKLEFPGMTVGLCQGGIVRPVGFGVMRVAPDGSLWQVHYANGRNPENMGFTYYYACYFFQSKDEGKSFQLKSWIQYLPDTNEFPEAFTTEGFCEPDLCFMPDGSMITLMRTGSSTPSYIARSVDGGNTWSKPQKFDRVGVLPQLQRLECGVTLATYGRPGIFVRATKDPSGVEWEDAVEILAYKDNWFSDFWGNCDSCCYTWMLPLDDHTVMMAYSDFRVKDEKGQDRKCIMVRTISVE